MKKNLPIIFAISLPILFVLILALSVTFSASKVRPEYDFVYVFQDDIYRFENSYINVDGKIHYTKNNNENLPKFIEKAPRLYFYDIESNSYKEITIDEVNKLDLIDGQISPDGYQISYGDLNFGSMFFGSSNNYHIISKDGVGKRINITNEYYYQTPTILGWVK